MYYIKVDSFIYANIKAKIKYLDFFEFQTTSGCKVEFAEIVKGDTL